MRSIGKEWAVLAVVFFMVAVSAGCARRPRPTASTPAAPAAEAPETRAEEAAPPTTAEREAHSHHGEERSGMGPGSGGTAEGQRPRGEEGEAAAAEALRDIHFDLDKYEIRPDSRSILERNALWIQAHSQARVQIEGHADERGTVEYNLALGERRAKKVRDYLISLGVDPKQLSTVSFGEERPLDPGHTEEAWAKNRRAHFVLLK
ncbi:MAG: peptidoglycan-associated lipoprotein Pal [Candidatus Tectomicrobia bacterium]|uniref:Peptidoglycan-associated lipoprotein n=2 Tax=Tectimicrobiota bacterium TaxID=2528274 RepID=A0A932CRN9_UNCTE|nr:peptidoglycan-associated lipoprotein Pal [Candidatus Tectomicrobia bacterium]